MNRHAQTPVMLKQRDQAFEEFSNLLLTLQVRPGQFVTQRELVELTGMPLGAIREMVPRLEADGLLSTQPKRGMQIVHIDLDLIRDAFQLRTALEKEAAACFARTAADEEITAMRKEHEFFLNAAQSGVSPELLQRAQLADWGFHDTLIDRMGNQIISKIYRVNSIKVRLIRAERSRMDASMLKDVMQDHLSIIDHFAEHDVDGAVRAIEKHIGNALQRAFAP
jgi:DNA-binding GntR family transcriptional regulator